MTRHGSTQCFERASPHLTKLHVRQLWEAGSFLTQEHGLLFNCRIRIVHDRLGLEQHSDRTAMVSDLVHELGQRLRYWAPSSCAKFHWLYVHENTSRRGFITTIIAHIPPHLEGDAEHWLFKRFLAKRHPKTSIIAVRFTILPKSENSKLQLGRHLQLMRSVCRAADPAIRVSYLRHRRALLDVLGIRNPSREIFQGGSGRRFRISEGLGTGAQCQVYLEGMEMLSAFGDRAYHHLLTGWEAREHQDRQRTRNERARELTRIEVEWPKGIGKRQDQIRQRELDKLQQEWGTDPRRRLRSWVGWWSEGPIS